MPKQLKSRRKSGYVQTWEEILESPAYRHLKPVARCLLMELQRIYRPNRNGVLGMSVTRAAELINCHKDTATKAFKELASHGFIEMTKGAWWRERQAREWRLTFEPCNGHEPTDEWRLWNTEKPLPLVGHKNP